MRRPQGSVVQLLGHAGPRHFHNGPHNDGGVGVVDPISWRIGLNPYDPSYPNTATRYSPIKKDCCCPPPPPPPCYCDGDVLPLLQQLQGGYSGALGSGAPFPGGMQYSLGNPALSAGLGQLAQLFQQQQNATLQQTLAAFGGGGHAHGAGEAGHAHGAGDHDHGGGGNTTEDLEWLKQNLPDASYMQHVYHGTKEGDGRAAVRARNVRSFMEFHRQILLEESGGKVDLAKDPEWKNATWHVLHAFMDESANTKGMSGAITVNYLGRSISFEPEPGVKPPENETDAARESRIKTMMGHIYHINGHVTGMGLARNFYNEKYGNNFEKLGKEFQPGEVIYNGDGTGGGGFGGGNPFQIGLNPYDSSYPNSAKPYQIPLNPYDSSYPNTAKPYQGSQFPYPGPNNCGCPPDPQQQLQQLLIMLLLLQLMSGGGRPPFPLYGLQGF